MLRKEFKDALKPTLIVLLITVTMCILVYIFKLDIITARDNHTIKIQSQNLIPTCLLIFAFGIIMIAGNLGLNVFQSEHHDQAFEYLLSSPLSKNKILLYKLVPALTIISVLLLLYWLAGVLLFWNFRYLFSGLHALMHPVFLIGWSLFYFLSNFFSAIFEQKNLVAVINVLSLVTMVLFSLAVKTILLRNIGIAFSKPLHLYGTGFIIGCLFLVIITGTAFFKSFKRLDLKPVFFRGKGYVKMVISSELLLFCFSIFLLINQGF